MGFFKLKELLNTNQNLNCNLENLRKSMQMIKTWVKHEHPIMNVLGIVEYLVGNYPKGNAIILIQQLYSVLYNGFEAKFS
jgi:hypothetical protein